jgi:hypothetical protein
MTPMPAEPALTFVLRSTWHVVEAGPFEGSEVGTFDVFKCFRWAGRKDWRQVARRRPGTGDLCGPCRVTLERGAAEMPQVPIEDPGDEPFDA